MRVLVTGAAGFLGSHLTDRLLAEGHDVIGVDNLSTGSLDNLSHLARESHFTFEERDVCLPFDSGPVGYVFNFASPAGFPDYLSLPIEVLHVGTIGTENALRIAAQYGAGFLHASTSECYGDPLVHPQSEHYWGNVDPIGPRSVYEEAKRYSEALTMAYYRSRGVNTCLARIFDTYGPRQRIGDTSTISTFMMQALQGEPLTIYGDGSKTRSFCYVSDLIEGVIRLSHSHEHTPVNIGNPEQITLSECAGVILDVTGSPSDLAFRALSEGDPMQHSPDISKARRILAWEPQIGLRDGIWKSLEYFKGKISAENLVSFDRVSAIPRTGTYGAAVSKGWSPYPDSN